MYSIARSGRFASRAVRLIPSTFTLAPSASFIPRHLPARVIASSYSSSTPRFSQYGQYAQTEYTSVSNADAGDFGAEDISNVKREFSQFAELGQAGIIDKRVINTIVNSMGIHTMTEVQRMTINECLDGTDVIAQARTGTGKTLAFLMPIVQRVLKDSNIDSNSRRADIGDTRALIISPTRELAEQIAVEAKKIVQGTNVVVQTAVGGTQKAFHLRLMQQQGCHILVGTPGRVKDLVSDPYSGVRLDNIQTFVLDEADRLLDIGFGPEIDEIQRYMPSRRERDRQTLMFSATIPRSVVGVVKSTMKPDFKFVRTVDPEEAATHESIPQVALIIPGLQNQIPTIVEVAQNAIEEHKRDPTTNMPFKAILFYNSVNEAHLAHEVLSNLRDPADQGGMFAPHPLAPCRIFVMSSQLDQSQRTRMSDGFRNSESGILISTDVSARGMDFPNVSHVIQVGLPRSTEDYVHRLGRTGRAGKSGKGYIIVTADERYELARLKKQIHTSNFSEESLPTSSLDMTQPSHLAPETARIMQMVKVGVSRASNQLKSKAYQTMLSSASQSPVGRTKQQVVDMVNANATYGWGMARPPTVSPRFFHKGGFDGTVGITVEHEDRPQREQSPRWRHQSEDLRNASPNDFTSGGAYGRTRGYRDSRGVRGAFGGSRGSDSDGFSRGFSRERSF
ncbi:hypothetical protein PV10_02506 [Exophiala mesophila]|uniref:ATP-dependent RNA helicase n=1 Tax=Exophiala mesophila TaxID=212818 RepID=A0A0D1ZLF5_EXOME|nr:uncharacterized protein PV10_02506 [Exophiala mesophila]KIV94774.1 hypothetical protein PV10_02506 [Exophiala mesophila]